jgi:urease accessory protein
MARQGDCKRLLLTLLPFVLALAGSTSAHAHAGHGVAGGLMSGLAHPLLGWDHLVAMLAVGLWGAFLRAPAIWLLPVIFPLIMAFGGALGVIGVPLPAVEIGIALSGVVLGLLIAFAIRMPLVAAVLMVAVFALWHGHAHGTELPAAADPFAYAVGFVIATGLLHLAGIAFGSLIRWPAGAWAVRAGGLAVSAVGAVFLIT